MKYRFLDELKWVGEGREGFGELGVYCFRRQNQFLQIEKSGGWANEDHRDQYNQSLICKESN